MSFDEYAVYLMKPAILCEVLDACERVIDLAEGSSNERNQCQ